MDCKFAGDLVYVLGETRNELGASEYYEHFGHVGLNVPELRPEPSMKLYRALNRAIEEELVASCHGIYRGGLGVHLALVAMGGGLGMDIDLSMVPRSDAEHDCIILYSESPGRFLPLSIVRRLSPVLTRCHMPVLERSQAGRIL
jgi:phosphoribosylformylglycinamidine synthase